MEAIVAKRSVVNRGYVEGENKHHQKVITSKIEKEEGSVLLSKSARKTLHDEDDV